MNLEFYPPIEPYHQFRLRASDLHELHVEECGNPSGKPVVFLHGGPGGGIDSDHRRYFDPAKYRIVLFDQRGAGRSTPTAELRENSTWDLVNDIEAIREGLKIEKWAVFGGSWGSTLALAYAIKNPHRVTDLILRGIFLCRPSEIQWFYQKGASEIFPDYWENYLEFIPMEERHDLVSAYYRRLTSDNLDLQLEAARRWSKWEAATSRLLVDTETIERFHDPQLALAFARIECHYFMNNAFFSSPNWLLENIGPLRKIRGWIIQGRYDVVCPARSAWDLHRAWPEAKLNMVPDAGHAAGEIGIRSALIKATQEAAEF